MSDASPPWLYFRPDELPGLKAQFESPLFAADRRRLRKDLDIIHGGDLAPTLFSWWCVNLDSAVLAGQYQASQEALLTAFHLCGDTKAPSRARELLLAQAALPAWTEPDYGAAMGHDLSSSHHCRAFAAGLEVARGTLSAPDLDGLIAGYVQKVRKPYLDACFSGNPYLVGNRDTNWLAHLSGSVLIVELALAKIGRDDRATMALAKANVLRYVDMIRPDGSLPELGDYYHYGMEFALLSLHAWSLHHANKLLEGYGQVGLSRSIDWPLAFTEGDGIFWADFGDAHIGHHEASRVVGYLFGRRFGSQQGQWLGDLAATREPLAALLRDPKVTARFSPPAAGIFPTEKVVVMNRGERHLAFRGGACRSATDDLPHRHYDSGSLIYRVRGVNVLADSGLDKYSSTFWQDFDGPNHERSAAFLHNVVLADGRGHRLEDGADGTIEYLAITASEDYAFTWRLNHGFPGLASWERHVIFSDSGMLLVIDKLVPDGARMLSVLWHMNEPAALAPNNRWNAGPIHAAAASNAQLTVRAAADHPKPYVSVDVAAGPSKGKYIVVASVFVDGTNVAIDLGVNETGTRVTVGDASWESRGGDQNGPAIWQRVPIAYGLR